MDFNKIIDRHDTASLKWDPLWRDISARYTSTAALNVGSSDFDFYCARPAVQEVLTSSRRARYFWLQRTTTKATFDYNPWFSTRHQLEIKQEWICVLKVLFRDYRYCTKC